MAEEDERKGPPRRVVITGASAGIGRATAEAFAERGVSLGLIARSKGELRSLAAELAELGAEAVTETADLGRAGAAEKAIARVAERLGGIDVLVVNAAATAYGPFEEISDRDFRRTVDVTFLGAVGAIRGGLPHLRRSEGNAVIVGSIVTELTMPLFTPYVAAKGALAAFTESLRAELRADGSPVQISLVSPGPVDTQLWKGVKSTGGDLPPVPFGSVPAERVAKQIVKRADRPRARAAVPPYETLRAVLRAVPAARDRLIPLVRWYLRRKGSPPEPGEGERLWTSSEKAGRKGGG